MVYLARVEDTDQAEIEWNFDFTTKNNALNVADISLRFDSKTYEDGLINIRFKHKGMRNGNSEFKKRVYCEGGILWSFHFQVRFCRTLRASEIGI